MINTAALTYDDVLLQPQYSNIRSRREIDIGVKLKKDVAHAPQPAEDGNDKQCFRSL